MGKREILMKRARRRVKRVEGITDSEKYLKKLCDQTFLSLWSYSNIFRDQGQTGDNRQGKEVCDLIVVFENHIILFSDKECEFPNSGDIELDWIRWYKRAVEKSAKQIWGAERWIKQFPTRLYLDRSCTQPFPLELPDPKQAIFHRIVVAHGVSEKCKQVFGGSGSLMISPGIKGQMHKLRIAEGGRPFTVGHVDDKREFVHVLDDTSLTIVLNTMDTITDFVSYLEKKEKLIASGKLIAAAGEEDLLAYYLGELNENDEHDFIVPSDMDGIVIDEGFWEHFEKSPERKAQINANKVSYSWDGLIETFSTHILNDTQYFSTAQEPKDSEKSIRFLAREPRMMRRMLAKMLLDLIRKSYENPTMRYSRVSIPTQEGDPYYVFLLLPHPRELFSYSEYREARRNLLEMHCMVVRYKFFDAKDIVGIATESGRGEYGSEDAIYFDGRIWNEQLDNEAKRIHEEMGLLSKTRMFRDSEKEYPV